ncbi:MAG: hypothetical protein ACLQM6_10240 [Acidobacteriaceae bacterium]
MISTVELTVPIDLEEQQSKHFAAMLDDLIHPKDGPGHDRQPATGNLQLPTLSLAAKYNCPASPCNGCEAVTTPTFALEVIRHAECRHG